MSTHEHRNLSRGFYRLIRTIGASYDHNLPIDLGHYDHFSREFRRWVKLDPAHQARHRRPTRSVWYTPWIPGLRHLWLDPITHRVPFCGWRASHCFMLLSSTSTAKIPMIISTFM
jgi:hypothetical protein